MFHLHARQCLLRGTLSYASCHLFYHLLYIVGPAVLLALLFFNLTFIALGNSYIPTEELLDKEEENQRSGEENQRSGEENQRNEEKKLYSNCLRSAETLSKTVLTNGVWI